jgi:hypothetical protein
MTGLKRDAHRANATYLFGLTGRQFRDGEAEQRLARGRGRPGQRQNVVARPLRQCAYVAGQPKRLGLDLPRNLQPDDKFVVWATPSRALDPGVQLLAA